MTADGAERLASMAREHRRAFGKVYTSHALAEFTLQQAVPAGDAIPTPVLDPAVGAGVFLLACLERIAAEVDLESSRGRHELVERARSGIWGIDVDGDAVELTRKALCAALERVIGADVDASMFDDNIVVGDFLTSGLSVLPRLADKPKLVVGNPPYVTADRIDATSKSEFRRLFATAHGRLDLYTLFMEQATKVVDKSDGTFAFITPDKFLSSVSASKLRDLLRTSGQVSSFGMFSSHRVFDDAATVPCVTVWRTLTVGAAQVGHVRVDRLSLALDDRRTPQVVETQLIDVVRLKEPSWSFQRTHHSSLEVMMTNGHRSLGEVTRRISAGLTTGYNPAFILDARSAAKLEPELVHPTVRGRDVVRHTIYDRGEYMLVPYVWSEAGKPTLIDIADFPKAKRWLQRHRASLEKRHCVRVWDKAWWDLHDPVGEALHSVPKVLVPDLARSNRFAADEGRYVPQHSVYYLTPSVSFSSPREIEALVAVLNSPAIEFLVRSRAPLVKDGFSRYRRQFLVDLPIPDISTDTQEAIHTALANERHDDLAELTCGLFGVEVEEVERAIAAIDESRRRSQSVTAGTGRVPPTSGAPTR